MCCFDKILVNVAAYVIPVLVCVMYVCVCVCARARVWCGVNTSGSCLLRTEEGVLTPKHVGVI